MGDARQNALTKAIGDELPAFQSLDEQAHADTIVPKNLDQPATARFIVHPLLRVPEAG